LISALPPALLAAGKEKGRKRGLFLFTINDK